MIKTIFKTVLLSLTALTADEVNFTFDGWQRECYLYKPSCIPNEIPDDFEPIPLVFMLHGLGGVGEDNYNFSALAEDSCFIVAFPQGMYNQWNIGPEAGHEIDDNSYLEALIDTIYTYYPVDTNKVYQTGHSMGGYMANHLNCTSNRFTAYGSSGGGMHGAYGQGNELHDICSSTDNDFNNPIIFTHGLTDDVVPDEWALFAIYHWINTNGCNANIYIDDWVMSGMPYIGGEYSDWEFLDFFIPHVLSSGDTLSQNSLVQNFQWSNGCHSDPSVKAVLLPFAGHEWHDPVWGSPIYTPLVHWNFFRQFSKDKMGPALDSLVIFNNGTINLDDNYAGTDIRIMAIDNYAVAQMTISFSGLVNVEGFDITIDFDSNSDNLIYMDTTIIFDSNIPSDNYETVQVSLRDFHDNEKVYDIDQLHDLDLYQQVGIINTLSNNSFEISPQAFHLNQNYPNPFNPTTEIGYSIPENTFVSITIYDVQGRSVQSLVNQNKDVGLHQTNWNGKDEKGISMPAGMYFYTIQTDNFKDTKKMILLK